MTKVPRAALSLQAEGLPVDAIPHDVTHPPTHCFLKKKKMAGKHWGVPRMVVLGLVGLWGGSI